MAIEIPNPSHLCYSSTQGSSIRYLSSFQLWNFNMFRVHTQLKPKSFVSWSGTAGSRKGEASDEDDDNEFFDAMEEAPEFITVPADPQFHKSVVSIEAHVFVQEQVQRVIFPLEYTSSKNLHVQFEVIYCSYYCLIQSVSYVAVNFTQASKVISLVF